MGSCHSWRRLVDTIQGIIDDPRRRLQRRLREKLELDPAHPEYIVTKWGVGYYFAD